MSCLTSDLTTKHQTSREPVAFACYFSSFEILSQGRKDENLWLFLGNISILTLNLNPQSDPH